jgi:hypothetical protein
MSFLIGCFNIAVHYICCVIFVSLASSFQDFDLRSFHFFISLVVETVYISIVSGLKSQYLTVWCKKKNCAILSLIVIVVFESFDSLLLF